jgi:hypothetical protein
MNVPDKEQGEISNISFLKEGNRFAMKYLLSHVEGKVGII